MASINFSRTVYLALRKAYAKAVAAKAETFVLEVEGTRHEFVTTYVKHLLEYLTLSYGRPGDKF